MIKLIWLSIAIVTYAYTSLVVAYPSMQTYIPNGANVYRNGRHWPAVGHDIPKGERIGAGKTGDNSLSMNSFGMMMKVEGMHWTQLTCNGDADGDGYTNGEELGDPDCVWTKGMVPARTTDISHPGYADSVPLTFKSKAQIAAEALQAEIEGMVEAERNLSHNSHSNTSTKNESSATILSALERILKAEEIEAQLRAIERREDRLKGKEVEDEELVLAREAALLAERINRAQLEEQQKMVEQVDHANPSIASRTITHSEDDAAFPHVGFEGNAETIEYTAKQLPGEKEIAKLLKKGDVEDSKTAPKEDL